MNVRNSLIMMVAVVALLAFSLPAHAGKTDSRIEETAKQSYVFKTYLKNDEIKVKSNNGVVTLTGVVSESFHKSLAQETVSGLPGVKTVDNRLETKNTPPNANSDEWLRDKVKATLTFHRSVNATSTEVTVKDGIVTLRGEAASQTQKELTTEYSRDLEGVKDVNNQMIVVEPPKKSRTVGEKIDDSSITAQVKMTLLSHRSTSALYTTVNTKRGVVTLEGKAKSQSEKKLATKLSNDVHGVKRVNNQMSVE